MASNREDMKKEVVDFLNKKYFEPKYNHLNNFEIFRSLDKILELMSDRELQLSILQIALFRQNSVKFDHPRLLELFKEISSNNFSHV